MLAERQAGSRKLAAGSGERANINDSGGVAQLVRACGSYPQGPGFKSLHRHHFLPACTSPTVSRERSEAPLLAARRPRARRAVRRLGFGRAAAPAAASSLRRGELDDRRGRPPQPRHPCRRRRGRAVLRDLAADLGVAVPRRARRCAGPGARVAHIARRCRPPGALRLLRARRAASSAPRPSRPATRSTIRRKHSCCS